MDISVLIYTAREDHPYLGRTEMHCLDPVTETLSQQTFDSFELIVIDALYEKRSDFFKEKRFSFPVTHAPASPNFWHARGRPGLCAQLNRGLAWCDGQLVWIGAENNLFPPHFLQTAWGVYHAAGKIPVAWYAILDGETQQPGGLGQPHPYPAVSFNMCGWTEHSIYDVDHRAERFIDAAPALSPCHYQHYFAYAGLPIDVAYALNGFDETLDGDLSALDVDMGSRIAMLKGEHSLAMHRDLWLMEPPTAQEWALGIQRRDPLKCGYALWWYNRLTNRLRVNTPYQDGWTEDVKQLVCRGACLIKDKCAGGDPGTGERVMYPFCEGPDKDLKQAWLDNLSVRDIANDADARRKGQPPFDRFTRSPPC